MLDAFRLPDIYSWKLVHTPERPSKASESALQKNL